MKFLIAQQSSLHMILGFGSTTQLVLTLSRSTTNEGVIEDASASMLSVEPVPPRGVLGFFEAFLGIDIGKNPGSLCSSYEWVSIILYAGTSRVCLGVLLGLDLARGIGDRLVALS
ncbi:hypothetical protein L195_g002961 [Trifolium pratense]|uniref:Uncharacterized protein n=1 Tax=Trifolium pratense TaxID=57577 RepID=A0A2K3NTY1_TRIPR|nr:hypothetical protein L195_g002961 [Trifolium pratense]